MNIFVPIVEPLVYYLYVLFKRFRDRGCSSSKTQLKNIRQYIDLYAGPEFSIHYKYSGILNVTFVTLMYGVGIPILYPIAFCYFFVLYIVEKGMLYYYYREPPQYDEILNEEALRILKKAPLFMLAFGYWMLSNRQLISN